MKFNGPGIVKIEPKYSYSHPPHKYWMTPRHEFVCMIPAQIASGKTNAMHNFILNHYKGYFHKIYCVCGTTKYDPKWNLIRNTTGLLAFNEEKQRILDRDIRPKGSKKLPTIVHMDAEKTYVQPKEKWTGMIPESYFFETLTDVLPAMADQWAEMDELVEKMSAIDGNKVKAKDKVKFVADRILLLVDDQSGLFKGGVNSNPELNFVFKIRHYNASAFVAIQSYTTMPRGMRINSMSMMLYEVKNEGELEMIYKDWSHIRDCSKEEWMAAYEYATEEPFSFFFINNQLPRGQRFWVNVDKMITFKEDTVKKDDNQATPGRKRALNDGDSVRKIESVAAIDGPIQKTKKIKSMASNTKTVPTK